MGSADAAGAKAKAATRNAKPRARAARVWKPMIMPSRPRGAPRVESSQERRQDLSGKAPFPPGQALSPHQGLIGFGQDRYRPAMAQSAPLTSPPRAPLAFRVGIVGHRPNRMPD